MTFQMNRRKYFQSSIGNLATAALVLSHSSRLNAEEATNTSSFRVGVIGHTGRGDFGHGLDKMWQRVRSTETIAISDSAGIEQAKRRLPGVEAFADYREMLRKTKPEIVAVAPRHIDQHHEMCMASIAHEVKGIYVEKPFCQTPQQADEIVSACESAGVRLAVAHRNRYHPVLPIIKRLIDDGEVGKPLEIRARGKEDHRGGCLDLWVLGSHVLNLACYFAGRPMSCQSRLLQDNRPCTDRDIHQGDEGVGPIAGDELHARFEMSSGIPLFFDSIKDHGLRNAGFGIQIIGNEGVIDFRIDREPLAHLRRGNPFQPITEDSPWIPISTAGVGQPEPIQGLGSYLSSHQAAGDDLALAIANQTKPICSAEEGRTTVEMICAIFQSHRINGEAISFPLENREHPLT